MIRARERAHPVQLMGALRTGPRALRYNNATPLFKADTVTLPIVRFSKPKKQDARD
jgi:hypothetical protein